MPYWWEKATPAGRWSPSVASRARSTRPTPKVLRPVDRRLRRRGVQAHDLARWPLALAGLRPGLLERLRARQERQRRRDGRRRGAAPERHQRHRLHRQPDLQPAALDPHPRAAPARRRARDGRTRCRARQRRLGALPRRPIPATGATPKPRARGSPRPRPRSATASPRAVEPDEVRLLVRDGRPALVRDVRHLVRRDVGQVDAVVRARAQLRLRALHRRPTRGSVTRPERHV
jgi:hypothetical protein